MPGQDYMEKMVIESLIHLIWSRNEQAANEDLLASLLHVACGYQSNYRACIL